MSSDRLRRVYDSGRWSRVRLQVIERAGGRCEHTRTNVFGEVVRCEVRDVLYGGTESLTVDHANQRADPYDIRFLQALCRRHHGMKDGGRARRGRKR